MQHTRGRLDEESVALPEGNVGPARSCPARASSANITHSSANQKSSRESALAIEQLEQQLSSLKSTCSTLEAQVATQRLLADSSSEAADAAAARAHSSLTQNIALKKKMKEELPRLADALARAQAERDAAVNQREAAAANHAVERNMMSSKIAGGTAVASPLLPLTSAAASTSQTTAAVSRAGLLQQQCQ